MPRRIHKALLAAAAIPLAFALSRASAAVAAGTRASDVHPFIPSRSGLTFVNPSPKPGAVGLKRKTAGRCGGMVFAALDYHTRGKNPPAEAGPGIYVQMRNISSLIDNAARFASWSIAPAADAWWRGGSVGRVTREHELPRVAGALAAAPAPLGLTRAYGLGEMSRNHQVVGYSMRQDASSATIKVYDPNFPGADDVVLEVALDDPEAPIVERHGGQVVAMWTGLFVENYAPPLLVP